MIKIIHLFTHYLWYNVYMYYDCLCTKLTFFINESLKLVVPATKEHFSARDV